MSNVVRVASISIVVLLTGCSTIVSSNNQTVTIKALYDNKEVSGATCQLQNSKGEWTTVTPQSVNIRKAWADLEVTCRKGAAVGKKTVKLQIWDTCGQEIYRSLITNFYRNSSLAMMVYSIDK